MGVVDDKLEITDVINLYALALDGHEWDFFDRIFTDDVHADYEPNEWTGRAEFVNGFIDFHRAMDLHQHTMMGHLVHVEGDVAYAFTYSNWLLVRHAVEGDPVWRGTGWYDDRLERTSQGWRISDRRCRVVSYSGNPQVVWLDGDETSAFVGHVLRHDISDVRYYTAVAARQPEQSPPLAG